MRPALVLNVVHFLQDAAVLGLGFGMLVTVRRNGRESREQSDQECGGCIFSWRRLLGGGGTQRAAATFSGGWA